MKTILYIALTLGLVTAPPPAPHKFEDGFVERTLAIVIRDELATAKYSIALNESTLRNVLGQWRDSEASNLIINSGIKSDVAPNSPTNQVVETPKNVSPSRIQTDRLKPVDQPQSNRTQPAAEKPATQAGASDTSQSLKAQPTSANPDSSNAENPESEIVEKEIDENPISKDLLMVLQQSGPAEIARRVKITCNGQPLQIKNVSASPAPRHPFNLVVQFEFEIPTEKSAKLQIEDQNFRQQTGAVRYALKSLGSTMLVKSSAAPIVVRAQRLELAGLSKKEIVSGTSISAQILLMSTSEEED